MTDSSSPFAEGRMVVPDVVRPGLSVFQVLADLPGGVSSVELHLDGVSIGPARVALPGSYDGEMRGPESLLALAETLMPVPEDVVAVTVGARVTGLGGLVLDIPAITVPVEPRLVPAPRWGSRSADSERLATRARHLAQVASDVEHRVLLLTHDLGYGGAQLYLQELVERLAEAGTTGTVVSHRSGPLQTRLEELGWPVLVTGAVDPSSPEQLEGHVLQVAWWAAEHGCRVALANTLVTFPGVAAAQRLGLPVIWAVHESLTEDEVWAVLYGLPEPHPDVAEIHRQALSTADRLVFVADATRALFDGRIDPGSGITVPYGVDLDAVDAYVRQADRETVRAELGVPSSALLLLCLGTVEPRKSPMMLAQAFLSLVDHTSTDVRLAIVGAGENDYVRTLRRYVDAHGTDRVAVVPLDPDSNRWHLAADVLVSAADNESLPRTMLEAMAFGRPVAGTRVFGVPELVTEGETGFLCEPRDVARLRDMLERVVTTPRDELREMGRRGRARVERDHDPRAYATWFGDEIDRLTARH